MNISKRQLLKASALLPTTLFLSGCETFYRIYDRLAPPPVFDPDGIPVVDIHAHTFNATDLPARRFLKEVVLERFTEDGEVKTTRVLKDEDAADRLIEFALKVLGIEAAPTALEELAVLQAKSGADTRFENSDAHRETIIKRVDDYLKEDAPTNTLNKRTARQSNLLKAEIFQAGLGTQDQFLKRSSPTINTNDIARRAYFSDTTIGRHIRWFSLFRKYRYVLVDQLAKQHTDQGYTPLLLTPALIDFSKWLDQPTISSLEEQMKVVSVISARPDGPVMHAYFPYDPLRQIYHERGLEDSTKSPLELAEEAVSDYGFLGIKLYPPMGFRAMGNEGITNFPERTLKELEKAGLPRTEFGKALDAALGKIYDLCSGKEVPIIAHARNSNNSNEEYGLRADPAYWLRVFEDWPKLRVCLAHNGYFQFESVGREGLKHPQNTWEWAIGNYVKSYTDENGSPPPVYADLSYFSYAINDDVKERARKARYLKAYVKQFDPECKNLLFGTDWMMLGREKGQENYTKEVRRFFKEDCNFTDEKIANIFHRNAFDYAGLNLSDRSRARILNFYRRNNLSLTRLKVL